MGLNCGIIGLPNVGKSTIFKALTNNHVAIENYPFCTVEPNVGKINVPDKRLFDIANLLKVDKAIPSSIEFIDIAGLVRGASKGEGLGNQFLGHIRQVDALIHVARCFDDENITHVDATIDPIRDIETTELELIFSDLEVIEKRLSSIQNFLKSHDKEVVKRTKRSIPILERLKNHLEKGLLAINLEMDEIDRDTIKDLNLITLKPTIYLCNINDTDHALKNFKQVQEWAINKNLEVLKIDGNLETELNTLSPDEKKEFLIDLGMEESNCHTLIKKSYSLLKLITFFTRNKNEVRAWETVSGTLCPQAAGKIHTDMEKGFIRAEIVKTDDLLELKSEEKIKEMGKLSIVGKNYELLDGDIMQVRFNV